MNNIVNENKLFFDRKNKQFYFYDETGKKKNVKGPKDAIQKLTKQANKLKLKRRVKKPKQKKRTKVNIFNTMRNPKNAELMKDFKTQVFDVIAASQTKKKGPQGKAPAKIKSLRSAQLASERLQLQAKNQERLFQMQMMKLLMKEQNKIKNIAQKEEKEKDKKIEQLEKQLKEAQEEEQRLQFDQGEKQELFQKDKDGKLIPRKNEIADYIFNTGKQLFQRQPQQQQQQQQQDLSLQDQIPKKGNMQTVLQNSGIPGQLLNIAYEGGSLLYNNRKNKQLEKQQKLANLDKQIKISEQKQELLTQKYQDGYQQDDVLLRQIMEIEPQIEQLKDQKQILLEQPIDIIDSSFQKVKQVFQGGKQVLGDSFEASKSFLGQSFEAGKSFLSKSKSFIGGKIKNLLGLQKQELKLQQEENILKDLDVSDLKGKEKAINKSLNKSKEKIADIFLEQIEQNKGVLEKQQENQQNISQIQKQIQQLKKEKEEFEEIIQQTDQSYEDFQQDLKAITEQNKTQEQTQFELEDPFGEQQYQQQDEQLQQKPNEQLQQQLQFKKTVSPEKKKEFEDFLKIIDGDKQNALYKLNSLSQGFKEVTDKIIDRVKNNMKKQYPEQANFFIKKLDGISDRFLEDLRAEYNTYDLNTDDEFILAWENIKKFADEKYKSIQQEIKLIGNQLIQQQKEEQQQRKEEQQQQQQQKEKEKKEILFEQEAPFGEQQEKELAQQKEKLEQQQKQQKEQQKIDKEAKINNFENQKNTFIKKIEKIQKKVNTQLGKLNFDLDNDLYEFLQTYQKNLFNLHFKLKQATNLEDLQKIQQMFDEIGEYINYDDDDDEGQGNFYDPGEEFQGLTKKEFKDIFYEEIAPNIDEDFQFAFIEEDDQIPLIPQRYYNPKNKDQFWNIAVFFISSKDDPESFNKHFTVFIHDLEIQEIYYYDPLGLIANDNFKTAQKKIQQYIEKQPQIIKLKINSVNTQKSEFLAGSQENDQNYCGIYSLLFIDRICVQGQTFKQATNFVNLSKPEQEIQSDILKQYSVIEQKGQGYQFIYQ